MGEDTGGRKHWRYWPKIRWHLPNVRIGLCPDCPDKMTEYRSRVQRLLTGSGWSHHRGKVRKDIPCVRLRCICLVPFVTSAGVRLPSWTLREEFVWWFRLSPLVARWQWISLSCWNESPDRTGQALCPPVCFGRRRGLPSSRQQIRLVYLYKVRWRWYSLSFGTFRFPEGRAG